MIDNQWYAAAFSHEIKKGKVTGVRRFGRNLVFFRSGSGSLACVDSLCAHRKASLEKGWIQDDHIKCPFHGIEYDMTGRCVYVPSDGRASTLDYERFHLKTYPVREIGGIVFVWYGDKEPDKEPDYFDIITDPSYTYDHVSDLWNVDYSRVIENQLDVSHLPFVHHNTIGRGGKTLCSGPKVEWLDDHTLRTSANNETDIGQTPKPAEECVIKDTNLTFKFPNMWLNHVTDKIMILAYFIPVDDEHAIISLRFYNKITGNRIIDKVIAWFGSRANIIVERQDKRIVETQIPKKTGLQIGENLAAADLPIIEYRSKRRALQVQNGGGKMGKKADIQSESLRATHNLSDVGSQLSSESGRNPYARGTYTAADQLSPEPGRNAENPKAMYNLSYGLFVCTTVKGGKANGCIINTAIQAASVPNTITVAVNKANYTCDIIKETRLCNISVLSTDASFALFTRFGFQSGRDTDKFEGFSASSYEIAENGIPYITEGTNAYFSLKVRQEVDLGSHVLFVCEPVFMTVLSDKPSCTYAYYQSSIKPKSKPRSDGTAAGEKTVWRCEVCGYEWVGEMLPDDFICPICKHPKEDFVKI